MQLLLAQNELLKQKIVRCEKEYLKKKKVRVVSPEIIIKMRKAISKRLSNEMTVLQKEHIKITNKLFY